MTTSNLLPEDVQCPNCGAELTLTEHERTRREFNCTVCRENFSVKPEALYCPQCGAEYRPEIKQCADCKVPLVESLAEETAAHTPDNYVEVLSTFNVADLAMIKSVFEGENIQYHLFGENFQALTPAVQPVRLFVLEDHVESALDLLHVMDLHATAVSPTTEQKDDDALGGKE